MAVTLPYAFDTGYLSKTILKGICVLAGIVVIPGLIKFLVIEPNPLAALGIACIGSILSFFCYLLVRQLCGATGIVTTREVVITPNRFLGIASKEPEGRFAIDQFQSILVRRIFSSSANPSHISLRRVFLMGKENTPNIEIARMKSVTLGSELGVLLNLPVEERLAPY